MLFWGEPLLPVKTIFLLAMLFSSKIKIQDLEISPPLALAPMVGLSHTAMRTLVQELGGVGVLFTEMLSAKRLPEENEHISPSLIRTPDEYPLFYQVFLHDASVILPALEKLHNSIEKVERIKAETKTLKHD